MVHDLDPETDNSKSLPEYLASTRPGHVTHRGVVNQSVGCMIPTEVATDITNHQYLNNISHGSYHVLPTDHTFCESPNIPYQ
jgi:hypothetical protein